MTYPIVQVSSVATVNPRNWTIEPTDSDDVSFVPMASVEVETGKLDPFDIRPWGSVKRGYTRFEEGDILVAKITPSMENGKVALARGLAGRRGVGSTEFHVLRPSPDIVPEFLLHYLLQASTRRDARAQMRGVAGQLRVPPEFYSEYEIPLPPIDEQKEIVAAIETQFARLDDAVAALQRSRVRLKRYRASVLKAACEGRLVPTEAELARQEGRSYEPASVLLERIKAERETAKERRKGKKTSHPNDDLANAELPEGWSIASVDQISLMITDGDHNPPKRVPSGVPHLTARNIRNWAINFEKCTYISEADFEKVKSRFEPKAGDLIVTCVGTVGETAIVPEGLYFSPDRNLAGIRLVQPDTMGKWLQVVLNAPFWQNYIKSASGATAQPHLYLGSLRAVPVVIPPAAEQERIVEEVERRLSIIDQMEATVEASLKRAESLRQSILRMAFSGRLT